MDFDVQVAHSVETVGRDVWDHLSGGRPFASYQWYRFSETVRTDDTPVYILVFSKGEPVGRATFWLTGLEPLSISSRPVRYLAQAMLRRLPLLICQSPLTSLPGLVLPSEPALRDRVLQALICAAGEQAKRYSAAWVLFSYLEYPEVQYSGWPETFTPVTSGDPGTYLPIAWPNFEAYLQQLSSKMRKNYRRYCRTAEMMQLVIKYSPTVSALDDALVLIRNVEKRHHEPPNPWVRKMLENASMVNSVWITAEIDGRLAGCELMLGDGDTWLVTAPGLDHQIPNVYFLLGYADIRYAIEHGARVLRWGSGINEVKQRFGFKLENKNYLIFTSRWPLLQKFGKWLAAAIPDVNLPLAETDVSFEP